MFDTMTMTKAIGALCGTFLVYLLGAWLAEEIYHTGGHGKHHAQAYVIEVADAEAKPRKRLKKSHSRSSLRRPVQTMAKVCGAVAGHATHWKPVSTALALRFTAS